MTRHPLMWQSSQTTEGERHRVLSKLEASGKDIAIVRLVANWESGFRPFILMADALLTKGEMSPKTREVAVLRMAATLGLEYEWEEHVPISERVGVTAEQRQALKRGGEFSSELFDRDQRIAIEVVDAVLEGGELEPAKWDALCDTIGEQAALELVFGIAWWAGYIPIVSRVLFPLTEPREM